MKISIEGNGVFGSFLKEVLIPHFEIVDDAESVILAVPLSAYDELGAKHKDKHLINICSVQVPSRDILAKYTTRITGIHPLFGPRTPKDKRNSIFTHSINNYASEDYWFDDDCEKNFIDKFKNISKIKYYNAEAHDIIMAKTHLAAVIAGKQAKVFVDRAKDIPDEFIPHSFRLLRDFVKTLEDMPPGTVESILANPY